jgi:hypothetical protein
MRALVLTATVLGMLSLPLQHASAWNSTGHMTVAKLAWDQLSASQQKSASETLTHLPFFDKFMSERPRPVTVPVMEWVFLNAATWPDWLRDFAEKGKRPDPSIGMYHDGPRHYINIPIITPSEEGFFKDQDLDPYKQNQSNVVNGLEAAMKDLKSAETAEARKAIALCWLLHLAGDIHQPLHCATYYSQKDYPKGDEGGNSWWVKQANTPLRLHTYWDEIPGIVEGFDHLPAEITPMTAMYRRIMKNVDILTRKEFERMTYKEELKRSDYKDWAVESVALAKDKSYRSQGELIGSFPFTKKEPSAAEREMLKEKAPAFPDSYTKTAEDVANRQLALAGYRLVDRLNEAFPKKGGNP